MHRKAWTWTEHLAFFFLAFVSQCLIFFGLHVHEQLIQVVQVLSLEYQKLDKFLIVDVFWQLVSTSMELLAPPHI